MKKIFLLCSIIILMSSCMTTKMERQQARRIAKCEKYGCNAVKDSVMIVRETVTIKHDTTIYVHVPGTIKHDTAIIVFKDPGTGMINSEKSILKTELAWSEAWVENGKLKHHLFQKDSIIAVKIQDAIRITKALERSRQVTQLPQERINYVTGWQWCQIWIGRIVLLLIGLIVCLSLVKFVKAGYSQ